MNHLNAVIETAPVINKLRCLQCGWKWYPKRLYSKIDNPKARKRPKICPRCKPTTWDIEEGSK